MAIVTRQARKADFETLLKPTIRASSLISVNEPLAIAVYNGSVFEFDEGGIVRPAGIQSEEAFGSPQVMYSQPVFPDGIASGEAFGTAVLNAWIQPTGIPSAEVFGTPQVPQIIICGGIASDEACGSPVLRYDQHITATGISSGELFGTSLLKWQRTEMLPSAPGLRFGMKKLPEKGSFKLGLKSVFGMKPISPVVLPPPAPPAVEECAWQDVVWISKVNVVTEPLTNDLTKYGGGFGAWVAGAISQQQIPSAIEGAGIKFKATFCDTYNYSIIAGLSDVNIDEGNTVRFQFRLSGRGADLWPRWSVSYCGDFGDGWECNGLASGNIYDCIPGEDDPATENEKEYSILFNASGELVFAIDGEAKHTFSGDIPFPLFMDTSFYEAEGYEVGADFGIRAARIKNCLGGDVVE